MKVENMKKLNLTQKQIVSAYNFDRARLVDVVNTVCGDSYLSFENYKRLKKDGLYSVFNAIISGKGISDHLSEDESFFFRGFCVRRFGEDFNF